MKVICAGYSKTGTKSMYVALQELGYDVYDYLDHFWYHGADWKKILSTGKGGSIADFQQMYKDVDAVTDAPAMLFWEQIHQAFPNAKVILTVRDEDKFFESLQTQIKSQADNLIYCLAQCFTPTGWRFFAHNNRNIHAYAGLWMMHPFDFKFAENELLMRKSFRQHQTYCRQNAPKDKLLVFHVKEGWEPLCKFLGKDVPDKPFPRENIAGNIIEKQMATHPCWSHMQREIIVVLSFISGVCFFLLLLLYL